jgi:hypothetical protein
LEQGWIAQTLNGDPFDLRDGNVALVHAPGRRASYLAVWDARSRWRAASQGLSPNAVFAERRKAARQEGKAAASDTSGNPGGRNFSRSGSQTDASRSSEPAPPHAALKAAEGVTQNGGATHGRD